MTVSLKGDRVRITRLFAAHSEDEQYGTPFCPFSSPIRFAASTSMRYGAQVPCIPSIPIEIKASVIGASVALVATWAREWRRERRRRRDLASALLTELRVYQRAVSNLIKASGQKRVLYDQGFSQVLFRSVMSEVSDMGPDIFLDVRSAYSYLGQLDHLRHRFEHRASLRPDDAVNLIPAYLSVCRGAAAAIERAIATLARYASRSAAKAELPSIVLSEEEERMFGPAV